MRVFLCSVELFARQARHQSCICTTVSFDVLRRRVPATLVTDIDTPISTTLNRLLFELSEVDLTCALEVKDEINLQHRIATLPDATVRALLLQAALLHPPTATRVLAAAPTAPPGRQPDTPPTPPEHPTRARDSFDALRDNLSRESTGRRTAQLNISGHVLDSDYFSTKATEVVAITNPTRRRDALASLCREINVMIDLGHGLFALRAIVAVLNVVTNRAAMDGMLGRGRPAPPHAHCCCGCVSYFAYTQLCTHLPDRTSVEGRDFV